MLTLEGCQTRRRRLWDRIPESIEWLLIADPRHVHYLANFWVQPLSFSAGERGFLLLERSGQATLLGDNFAIRSAVHSPYVDREVVTTWYDHKHSVINRDHALLKALGDLAGELRGRPGLLEAEWLPLGAAAILDPESYEFSASQEVGASTLIDLGTILRLLRRTKETDEVDLMRQCMAGGAAGQKRLLEIARPGLTEFEVFREVQNASLAAVGRPALVYGDFRASWPDEPKNGGLPKGAGRTLQDGDLFVLDYSVLLDGYRSDFTNTVAIGAPSDGVKELHALCLEAMRLGEESLCAGVAASEVHRAVAKPFVDAGKPEAFPHHAGHGIGLAHPEAPILVPLSTDTLAAGNVVTLEPGAYVKGVGGMRIEHNYLITDQGSERLSHHEIRLN